MESNDSFIYAMILFAACFITLFEVYRVQRENAKLKRAFAQKTEDDKAHQYVALCNIYGIIMKELLESEVVTLPEDFEGTADEMILANFLAVVPDSSGYIKPKEN